MSHELDNPVYDALQSVHARFALGAIRLYESLGFRIRGRTTITVVTPRPAS